MDVRERGEGAAVPSANERAVTGHACAAEPGPGPRAGRARSRGLTPCHREAAIRHLTLRLLGLLFVLVGLPSARGSAQDLDSLQAACLRADSAGTWHKVALSWKARAGERGSNPALRARLLALQDSDQAVRAASQFADSVASPTYRRRLARRDSADAAALLEIVRRHGWPGRSLVGPDGAHAAFLIAQHVQALGPTALRHMKALPTREVNPEELAMLEDRVRVEEGKAQRFGSQLQVVPGDSALRFYPIEDPSQLDERRAAAGMPPLSVYMCLIGGAYGRPVVDPRAGPAAPPR